MLLDERLDHLQRIFKDELYILAVFAFGSQIDGYATPRSDVDLAVLFDADIPLREQLMLQAKVAEILGKDVDLISIKEAPLLLRRRALQGELLFERDPMAVANLIEDTLRRYRDFAPRLREGRATYYESLRQDYETRSRL